MTELGTVIDGKYEILKEIGRGGMSVVYLATDTHLNKNWAVKEIQKKGGGKNDEIIVNSLLAEANLMKRLDHAALPRIVDIIDNGITIYIVMDFIEGESLDKVVKEHGAQPEELVIDWAKQICDALSYLHSQKPPIIYRDMKPANVMLKDDGNIKIIDFGIAREYKEQNLADTTVLGTRGYAPPEQYSGQTDPRSDVFALGMTMHHLLTGVDPRIGEAYASVRQWNPSLTEGIEVIIDKCVEPAPEHRYQNCNDLLYDLEYPELVTKGYKQKQRRKLTGFIISAALSVLFAVTGVFTNLISVGLVNKDYKENVDKATPDGYYSAIEIDSSRVEAWDGLATYYEEHESFRTDTEVDKLASETGKTSGMNAEKAEFAKIYFRIGRICFTQYCDDSIKKASSVAKPFFEKSVKSKADFDEKQIAECYLSICEFMNNQRTSSQNSLEDYEKVFDKVNSAVKSIQDKQYGEAAFDKISFYYVTMLFVNNNAENMASVGVERKKPIALMETLYNEVNSISTWDGTYQKSYQDKINEEYDSYIKNINKYYDSVEKYRERGNLDG